MKYAPFSHSKLETFYSCPFKFKLTYIDKIRPKVETSIALLRGSYFHHLTEQYSVEQKPNPDYKIPDDLRKDIEDLFERSLGGLVGKYLNSDEFVTVGTEVAFGLDEKFNPCNYYSKSAVFRGFIDKILKKDGEFWVVDWKTGKYKDLQYQSFEQVKLYAIWLFRMYPEVNRIHCTYVYPESDNENEICFERSGLSEMAKGLAEKVRGVETSEEFPKCESRLCEYCDFRKAEICKKD
jgi:ATP-dependent helicase/DNAse subunit B